MDANGSDGRATAPESRSPEELVDRVQQLTGELERTSATPRRRALAEELVGAVIELYGEGLERIFAAIGDSGEAEALGERLAGDGVVASLMLIHDLYPGAARRARRRGARPRAPVHGVARRQRRAARDRGRDRAHPARGQLRGLPGVVLDARAGDQVGARRGRARPRGPRGRGGGRRDPVPPRGRTRSSCLWSRWRRASPSAPPAWFELDGVAGIGEDRAGAGSRSRARGWSSPGSRATCSPFATPAPAAARRWRAATLERGHARAAPRASVASSCPARAARSTTTACSSTRCRCSRGSGRPRVALSL